MRIGSQEWRIDCVHRLSNAIFEEAAGFDADFGVATPVGRAWAKLVVDDVQEHVAYLRGQRDTRPPRRVRRPSEAEVERARLEMEATKQEPTPEQLTDKKARWRRLWVRSFAAIMAFEWQQQDAVGEERAWADRVADEAYVMVAQLRRTMEAEYPGMPPTGDIETAEIFRAFLLDALDALDHDGQWSDEGRPGTSSGS
jgi:hypothetical protein